MFPPTPYRLARSVPRLLAIALLVGGCVSTEAVGWRYDTTSAPTASSQASAAPSASAASSPCSTATTGTTTINLAATNIAFDQSALTASACQTFKIVFQNNDASVQHNVEIKGGGQTVFKGDLLTGVGSATYDVPALQAGAYTFNCTVHPNMTGTLTVQ